MSESTSKKSTIHLNVDAELYTQYKIALLQRYPRRNVTQDLIAYMKSVVAETEEKNKI